jgi:alpha-mannosidase
MEEMITVHMIGNAHLDPVWLWRWPAGVVEALSTCRTACDLLDEFPRFIFTRSDQWVHERIEELDPALFQRIRKHAASGRWALVGGWYIQPDCNFPLEESFRTHMEMGRRYFEEKLGARITVGYNVDSFGHAGSLPRLLAEHGFDSYVMMRPGAHEKAIPASLFRWRSTAETGGVREVLTWRIAGGYGANDQDDLAQKVRTAMEAAAPGVDHVMCFYGVGDHGGGPTRTQIEWIMGHQDAIPGARLVFSHPRAFFDAVKPFAERLPIVAEELQFHAIGCYSVERPLKQAMRAAEHGLHMARQALEAFPADAPAGAAAAMETAWKKTLFNQFHDIYGGTSLPAACEDSLAQLGAARDSAESLVHSTLLRHAAGLPPATEQRIWVFNASDEPFDGYIRWEPWMDWGKRPDGLADQAGRPVPVQVVDPASTVPGLWGSLVWPASLAPRQLLPFSLLTGGGPAAATDLAASKRVISNSHWELCAGRGSSLAALASRGGARDPLGPAGLTVRVFDDPSDTWSHAIDRYAGRKLGDFSVKAVVLEESGPVRASLRVDAAFGKSSLSLWLRLYAADPRVEMEMRLDWHEKLAIAKLLLPFPEAVVQRLDGVSGGGAVRPQDGREYPLIDWTQARLGSGACLGIACPDCMSLDGEKDLIRFTLARSPVFAWHNPARLSAARAYQYTDQGEHRFRFTLMPGAEARALARESLSLHRPPVCFDWTKGM